MLRPLDAGAASEMFSEPRAVDEGPLVRRTGTRSDVLFISSCQVAAVFVGGTHGRHASDGTSTLVLDLSDGDQEEGKEGDQLSGKDRDQ